MNETKKVLVVDDDPDVVLGLRARLNATGYETIVATDCDDGLAAAAAEKPDAIVLDLRLPDDNGMQTLAVFRGNESTKDIPIVMLSASLHAQQMALDAGARFFLTKPYQGSKLVDAVATAIQEKGNKRP